MEQIGLFWPNIKLYNKVMMKNKYLFLVLLTALTSLVRAQVGYGTKSPAPSAVLDVFATNKGMLIPRVNLLAVDDSTTITPVPVNALTVFNLANANGVTPGYYYYSKAGKKWIKLGERTWALVGNAQTSPTTDFIGTSDNQDVIFKRNWVSSGLINLSLQNTAFGVGSLQAATGSFNTAVGFESLSANLSGEANVAVGSQALKNNISGNNNIANGYQALFSNQSGSNNIAFGFSSLYNNIGGNDNIAVGYQSLQANVEGKRNLAIGYQSLFKNKGDDNTAIGLSSLYNNSTGEGNVAIGSRSLNLNDTGKDNVAIGANSLSKNNGSFNTANGLNSLTNNTLGTNNTAFGPQSLSANTEGNYNVGIGANAGSNLSTGSNNVAIGTKTAFVDGTKSNQLNIGNAIFGTETGTSTAKIGINTASPNSTLHVQGSLAAKIVNLPNSGINLVADNDYTVLVSGNIVLPQPTVQNQGRMYYLINDTVNSWTIGVNVVGVNYFKDNGTNLNNLSLSNLAGNKGFMVQSIGLQWVVINKY